MTPENLEEFCQGEFKPSISLFTGVTDEMYSQSLDMDVRMQEAVDSTMCRKGVCPCVKLG